MHALLLLREPWGYLEAWLGPGLVQQTPHFWGKATAPLPLPCALFFVLLKFSPPCRWSPPPPQPQKGEEGRELLETQTVQRSCIAGDPPATGPSLFTLAGWGKLSLVQMAAGGKDEGESLSSTQSLQRGAGGFTAQGPFPHSTAQTQGQKMSTVDAGEGRGSRSDCKG